MRKLTEEQIQRYIKPAQKLGRYKWVEEISEERLRKIDLDAVPKFVRRYIYEPTGEMGIVMSNGFRYKCEANALKANMPSYSGRQILIGLDQSGELIFSDGVWFDNGCDGSVLEQIEHQRMVQFN